VNLSLDDVVRQHWWATVATMCRVTGDVSAAEDAVQEACAAAVIQWPVDGVPSNPMAWLIRVARNKAIDAGRRARRRPEREAIAMRDLTGPATEDSAPRDDDMLRLVFLCCHPALDPTARVALTLRLVCGLSTREIAAGFLVPEHAMAKRLQRAKRKIRDSRIPLRTPDDAALGQRLSSVLRVIFVAFTEGHTATDGPSPVRPDLCETCIDLARGLVRLLPNEPEVTGLLALLLLTDARRAARLDEQGDLVLLEDQDRRHWDQRKIVEGRALVEAALSRRQPGPYQIHAAIAACHADAADAASTDWRQIALLYDELLRIEPSPITEANRAVAVAMSEGPAAGVVTLDVVGQHPRLQRWPHLHIARGELLRRAGRDEEALSAFRTALELEPAPATRRLIQQRVQLLGAAGERGADAGPT
jgi:RNA polymerase sigma-70 factor, ECF subfamily